MTKLTAHRLREVLAYDPETGVFTWKVRPSLKSRRRAGDEAGSVKKIAGRSYRYIGVDGVAYLASQLAWLYVTCEWPNGRVECKNGQSLDLRFENLATMPTVAEKFDRDAPAGRAAYLRAHRAAHPMHYRAKDLRRDFGISTDDYQRMHGAQDGRCAICGRPETATRNGKLKWLAVDHDHDTGAMRGLLCADCNTGIGKLQDDPAVLRRAVAYLERHAAPVVRTHPAFPGFREHVVPIPMKDAA